MFNVIGRIFQQGGVQSDWLSSGCEKIKKIFVLMQRPSTFGLRLHVKHQPLSA
jgi:hypothetical protein